MSLLQRHTLLLCGVKLLLICAITNGSPTERVVTYDQRQTGHVNIQISVKDVEIVALLGGGLGGSEDYDYNYDYSELTMKPSSENKTTTSTAATTTKKTSVTNIEEETVLTTTERVVAITPASPLLKPKQNNTHLNSSTENSTPISQEVSTTQKPSIISENSGIPVQILTTPVEIVYNHKETKGVTTVQPENSSTSTAATVVEATQAECIDGYRKDRRGTCRPKIKRPTQQTLLRKLIQLSHRMQAAPTHPHNKRLNSKQ